MTWRTLQLALLFLPLAPTLSAGTLALLDSAGQGTQTWQGNLGIGFTVNSTITVTGLGVFNADGSGNVATAVGAAPLQVGIFNFLGSLVTPVATFQGHYTPVGLGFDVMQPISPSVLAPGNYILVVLFNGVDLNGNALTGSTLPGIGNTAGGVLSFPGTGYYAGGATLTSSGLVPYSPVVHNLFNIGTFEFGAGVPEPASLALFGLGSALLMAHGRHLRIRRRSGLPPTHARQS